MVLPSKMGVNGRFEAACDGVYPVSVFQQATLTQGPPLKARRTLSSVLLAKIAPSPPPDEQARHADGAEAVAIAGGAAPAYGVCEPKLLALSSSEVKACPCETKTIAPDTVTAGHTSEPSVASAKTWFPAPTTIVRGPLAFRSSAGDPVASDGSCRFQRQSETSACPAGPAIACANLSCPFPLSETREVPLASGASSAGAWFARLSVKL